MTFSIALLLVIIAVTLVLFSLERLPADVVALGVLVTLIVTGLLPADQAFAGFGSDAFIMILGLLILTAALLRTGVVEWVGRAILRRTGDQPGRLLAVVMGSASLLSAFMSNTAATAFFVPVVIGLARRAKVSAARLLMPLAFASILSSSVTLVSTSSNIVVSGLMTQHGMAPMGMFELAPVGIPVVIVGLLYMFFVGRRIIPDRETSNGEEDEFRSHPYLTEVMILEDSPWIGKTLKESRLGEELNLTVVRVVREKYRYLAPQADLVLQAGDVLLVEGQRDEILNIKKTAGIDIKADVKLSDPSIQDEDFRLVEGIILLRSPLIGRTLKGIRFRERYGLQVLAINRRGETITRKISQTSLRVGDILLIQGHRSNVAALEADNSIQILGAVDEINAANTNRAPIAVLAFVGAIALGTFNILPFPVAGLLGVLVVFLTRCITPEEAYREVEWKALILIGSMLGLGAALVYTGTADYIAGQIVSLMGHANPLVLLGVFFILTVLLTQPMSNQAAAVVVVPIAIETAVQLGLNPRTFAMMIAVAASCSYLTPLEPSCLMVYGPGRYRFMDFLKVGSILTLLIFLLAMVLVPMIWPLA